MLVVPRVTSSIEDEAMKEPQGLGGEGGGGAVRLKLGPRVGETLHALEVESLSLAPKTKWRCSVTEEPEVAFTWLVVANYRLVP